MNRREFLTSAAALAAIGSVRGTFAAAAKGKVRLAAQMYSVRGIIDSGESFRTMLKLMKKFGYDGVELCGSWMPAKDLKKFLDGIGLAVAGSHCGLGQCMPATIGKTCDDALAYGNDKIVMPWAQPPKGCADEKGFWRKLGDDLSAAAEVAKKHGVHLLYHNHGHEFTKKIEGKTLWDFMFENSSPALEFQIDVGHVALAKADAKKLFADYHGRIRTIHAKPFVEKVNWSEINELCLNDITEWYVVEAEANPCDTQKMKTGADIIRKNCPFL